MKIRDVLSDKTTDVVKYPAGFTLGKRGTKKFYEVHRMPDPWKAKLVAGKHEVPTYQPIDTDIHLL